MISALEQFVTTARWFGGKGRSFRAELREQLTVDEGPPLVRIELVTVTFADGETATYQLPLVYYDKPHDDLEHAMVGTWVDDDLGEVFAYDALHDHDVMAMLLHGFVTERTVGRLRFHRLLGHEIDPDARSALLTGEQSNSSVAFGEDSLLKVFRKVSRGRNPDIDVHIALTEAGSEHVAGLYGWLELEPDEEDGEPLHLAMLQQFLRTASDGFGLALASVRDLVADPDVLPAEAGGDFAAEAHRLGNAVAEVHYLLARAFPGDEVAPARVADAMQQRLDAAVLVAPTLTEHRSALGEHFDALRALPGPIPVQRIHGDLHLGQTLRTVKGWKLVDFEGEPVKPLAERVLPDSTWRDVAGMLRSFDYAAATMDEPSSEPGGHAASRSEQWSNRNRQAFLDGYREVSGVDARDARSEPGILVTAYEADKAVYEVVYETRNRPDWVGIPLQAIARLVR